MTMKVLRLITANILTLVRKLLQSGREICIPAFSICKYIPQLKTHLPNHIQQVFVGLLDVPGTWEGTELTKT